jgi:hypothetical protein
MQTLTHDLRVAARSLRTRPGFTAVAVVILGVAIGLNSAVFSVVNAVLIRPLPVTAPDELVRIYSAVPDDLLSRAPMAEADVQDLREQGRSFSGVAASWYTPMAVEHRGAARLVMGERVSGEYFSVLGVQPALGRSFGPEDTAPESTRRVAILSHSAWQNRFGADPGVIGESVGINGRPYTVIGVAPATFFGITRGVTPELWLPDATRVPPSLDGTVAPDATSGSDQYAGRRNRGLWVVARLAPGVSFRQAETEVTTIASRSARVPPPSCDSC